MDTFLILSDGKIQNQNIEYIGLEYISQDVIMLNVVHKVTKK